MRAFGGGEKRKEKHEDGMLGMEKRERRMPAKLIYRNQVSRIRRIRWIRYELRGLSIFDMFGCSSCPRQEGKVEVRVRG